MARQVFDVLSLRTHDDGSGRRAKAVGPLGDILQPHLEPRRLLAGALWWPARVGRDGGLTALALEAAVNDQGLVEVRPRGLLAPLLRSRIEQYIASINRNKVIGRLGGANVFSLYQPPVPSKPMVKLLAGKFQQQFTKRPRPSTCTLQVTSRCQCDCEHCSAARFARRGRRELSTEEMISVIRQAERLGIVNIVFTGGEPLLRKDLPDLIAAVNRDEANPMMFTNGQLLDDEHVEKLARAGLYSMYVSLDSVDPETHNRLRRTPGLFQQAVAGIRRVRDAGIFVGISTYATREKVRTGEIRRMIELGRELGVHEVTVFDVVPTGKLMGEAASILLSEADKDVLIEMEYDFNSQPGLPAVITQARINGPRGSGCFAGYFQFYMTAYGDITPCDFTPLCFGNVREQDVATIWAAMTSHEAYNHREPRCRMQNLDFRARYVDAIPDDAPLPYPVDRVVCDKARAMSAT
jgi:MoaA/NifB/PqqE/SkfB family radical SAM enzyme